jgi:hypothetical protein
MKKIKLLIALLAFCLGAVSQPVPSLVYCTLGEYPEEIYWEIQTCETNNIIASGYAGDSMWVVVPGAYDVYMEDNYGDGWNGAYLHIGIDSLGFLSDVDWIATIGTWPQIYTDTLIDMGCLTLGTGTGSVIDDGIKEIEYIFEPVEFYNLAGQKVIPNSTGIYIASDGYIRKLVYLTK